MRAGWRTGQGQGGRRDRVGKTGFDRRAFKLATPVRVSPCRPAANRLPQAMKPDGRQRLTACTEPARSSTCVAGASIGGPDCRTCTGNTEEKRIFDAGMGAAVDRGRGHASGRHGDRPFLLYPAHSRADRGRWSERCRSRHGRGVQSRRLPDRRPRRPLAPSPDGRGRAPAGVPVDHARLHRRQHRAGRSGLADPVARHRRDHDGRDDGLRARGRHPPRAAGPPGRGNRNRVHRRRDRDPGLRRSGAASSSAEPCHGMVGARALRRGGRGGGALGMAGRNPGGRAARRAFAIALPSEFRPRSA